MTFLYQSSFLPIIRHFVNFEIYYVCEKLVLKETLRITKFNFDSLLASIFVKIYFVIG